MPISNSNAIVEKLRQMQRLVRDAVIANHESTDRATVKYATSADTIYGIDVVVDEVIEAFVREWSKELPMIVIAEGMEPESGKTFPEGSDPAAAKVRLIMDPVDGTRGLMYDKRAAWSLAGMAPNKGSATRLSDIEIAVMTELPTSKMGQADVLWAIRGHGAHGVRESLYTPEKDFRDDTALLIHPSKADNIQHGFAIVSNFFPGTKVLASEAMEFLIERLLGQADVTKATVFEDQYISTGGQFYELIVGHDRINSDLRPWFYKIQRQPEGLCCHPYDCATLLVAEEAGVIITNGMGEPLDGPLDTTTGLSWAGFANKKLYDSIQPLLTEFLTSRLQ
ncbi:hypothetical protein BH10PLA1_BH10PLA1_12890 [soil metagenome]